MEVKSATEPSEHLSRSTEAPVHKREFIHYADLQAPDLQAPDLQASDLQASDLTAPLSPHKGPTRQLESLSPYYALGKTKHHVNQAFRPLEHTGSIY